MGQFQQTNEEKNLAKIEDEREAEIRKQISKEILIREVQKKQEQHIVGSFGVL